MTPAHAYRADDDDPWTIWWMHVVSRVSVSELAAMAGLSASHYTALFRRATGYGVREFQIRLRMGRARELLDTTPLAVATIARAVGYGDALYFSRHFRRIHGMSPSSYRDQAKG